MRTTDVWPSARVTGPSAVVLLAEKPAVSLTGTQAWLLSTPSLSPVIVTLLNRPLVSSGLVAAASQVLSDVQPVMSFWAMA